MSDERRDVRSLLDAWRASGADRVDPVRFRTIDAFARRAAGHEGDARRVLDERLHVLLDAYAAKIERTTAASDADAKPDSDARANAAPKTPLAELTDYLATRPAPHRAAWPELPMLDEFRKIWSRFATEVQLRQSREQVPTNAGPLNSSSLVHRALSLMREQSPAYLQHFLSYVDALSWMEQLSGTETPVSKETRRTGTAKPAAKKAARSRPRQ